MLNSIRYSYNVQLYKMPYKMPHFELTVQFHLTTLYELIKHWHSFILLIDVLHSG